MPVYVVTGKLGSGKTLLTVSKIKEYLCNGRRVATNLDLDLVAMLGRTPKSPRVIRMPDKPRIEDFESVGSGKPIGHRGEDKNGLMVLDELGTWFNSREWNAKGRKELINWLAHSRKDGWDLMLIVQDISVLDTQARTMFAEHVVYCMRTDRLSIPFISFFLNLAGFKAKMGKIHRGLVKYGTSASDPVVDRWWYRGNDLYSSYDTDQKFKDREVNDVDWFGNYSLLPPWLSSGRYMVQKDLGFYMRMTKIYFKRFSRIFMMMFGLILGSFFGSYMSSIFSFHSNTSPVLSVVDDVAVKNQSVKTLEDKKVQNNKAKEILISEQIESIRFNELRIVEFSRVDGANPEYVFEDRKGVVYYGQDLMLLGVRMTYLGYCRLRLSFHDDHYISRCMYKDSIVNSRSEISS